MFTLKQSNSVVYDPLSFSDARFLLNGAVANRMQLSLESQYSMFDKFLKLIQGYFGVNIKEGMTWNECCNTDGHELLGYDCFSLVVISTRLYCHG